MISSELRIVSFVKNMSNSIGHNLLHSTVLEHQSKFNSSGIPANSLYQVASVNQAEGKSSVSTKFYGTSLNVRKPCLAVDKCRPIRFIPCAVLAMNPASEVIFHILELMNTSYNIVSNFVNVHCSN